MWLMLSGTRRDGLSRDAVTECVAVVDIESSLAILLERVMCGEGSGQQS
jgi:hypothetical protein